MYVPEFPEIRSFAIRFTCLIAYEYAGLAREVCGRGTISIISEQAPVASNT